MAMIIVKDRLIVGPMPWMPMNSRGIQLICLKGINQGYLVIMSIGLTRLSLKTKFNNCSLQSIA